MKVISFLVWWILACSPTHPAQAWLSRTIVRRTQPSTRVPTTAVLATASTLPDGYQEYGEAIIRKAGNECGIPADDDKALTIDWKAGKILVTVHGQVYVSATPSAGEGEEESNEVGGDLEENSTDASTEPMLASEENETTGVDVTKLARAINAGLDDGGVGLAIAETHAIEVTTPGAPDELEGVMWEAYKGFDVIVQHQDPKKPDKVKQIDGRLVERNDEFTIINIKGRMKKLKNDIVVSVRLPKAKREKGGG